MPVLFRDRHYCDTAVSQEPRFFTLRNSRGDQRLDFTRRLYDPGIYWDPQIRVADDPDRIFAIRKTAGKQRIVCQHSPDADHDPRVSVP